MSGLLSFDPSRFLADPAGAAVVVMDSIARNLPVEGEEHRSSVESHPGKNHGDVLSVWRHIFCVRPPRGDAPPVYGLVAETVPEAWLLLHTMPAAGLGRVAQERTAPRPAGAPDAAA